MAKQAEYLVFYQRITAWFRKEPGRIRWFCIINQLLTAVIFVSYPVLLLTLFLEHNPLLYRAVLVPGVSFGLVSWIRDRINAPRPYEEWRMDPLIPKETKGHSMPSRHVFSTAVIAMTYLRFQTAIGIIMLLLAVLSASLRVVGGVHYPRDVIVGFAVGAAAGFLMFIA